MDQLIIPNLLAVLVIAAAASDMLSYRIPNWLTLGIAVLFLPLALMAGVPASVMASHLLAGGAGLLAGILLFAIRAFGGGDAKLIAALALWLGWSGLLPFLVWTVMAGGLLGLLIGLRALSDRYIRKVPARKQVPYGVAIAAGAIIALPHSIWMSAT